MSTLRDLPKIEWRRAITVEEAPTGLVSVAVVDAEGARHVVKLRDPLALPPATAA